MKIMKKILMYMLAFTMSCSFWSCSEEELSSESIFDTSEVERNQFDQWLLQNYIYPYNIDFKYRMEDIESDMNYALVPAEAGNSVRMAKLVKYCWLEAYDEVAGIDFTRTYVPKVIQLIGSAAYDSDGFMVLGTAEGGLKITLYLVNSLQVNREFLNNYYFRTMHHEFAHILHQTKSYDPDFEKVSVGNYIGEDWIYSSDTEAHQAGFVTPYAQSEPNEDFVENIATYVIHPEEYWNALLEDAGDEGAAIILEKFGFVQNYLKDIWDIDINQLRDVVQRRTGELDLLDLDNL